MSRLPSTRLQQCTSSDEPEDTKRKCLTERSTKKQAAGCRRLIPRIKKTAPGQTLLPMDQTLRERWYIRGMIGHGGYGEIYYAIDVKQAEEVAIKAEPKKRRGRTAKRMILEQKVLLRLQGRPHVPKMIASGNTGKINFIVMQLLSVNVGDLKKASPVRRLGKSTVGRILQQAIGALRDVHSVGYIHRDVKPANMCFGVTPQSRHVLMLVDFGLVRRYKHPDGTFRQPRPRAGFRGTIRYVSIRVHDRIDQAPCDDLVALLYSGIELLIGELPWKYTVKSEDVRKAKENLQSVSDSSFLSLCGDSFQEFARAVISLNSDEEPNYSALQALLQDMVGEHRLSDLYDWENDYRDALDIPSISHSGESKSDMLDNRNLRV